MVENEESTSSIARRRYLGGVAAGAALGLAGCTSGDGDDGGDGGDGGGGDGGGGDGGDGSDGWSNELEVLHGWAGGDGEIAITALTEAFKEEYPDMETTFQAVGASANVDLNATVLRRMVNDNAMSSFANWPGKNLERYRGELGDFSNVWEDNGYADKIQSRAADLHEFNGKMVGVPIGSHRMNNLFYNVQAFEEAGVDAESLDSIDALLDALEAIDQETDFVPMAQAMVAPWTVLQLWVQVFTGQSGVDAYMDFIEGDGDRQAMIDALEVVQEIQENYITSDASSISFTDAGQKMIAGECATQHQGNWVYGMYRADDGYNYKEHWDWIPFPGTEGVYFYHLDSFIGSGDNPSRAETEAWLEFVGTKEAQIEFNNPKGSVPLRTDIDPDELTDFLGMTYEDLTDSEEYPPTLVHGLAVQPEQLGSCREAISNNFMGPYDAGAAADALLDAVSQ